MRKILLLLIIITSVLFPQLRLPSIISDNMVLKKSDFIKLWGWANKGANVVITSDFGKWEAKANDIDGYWEAELFTGKDKKSHTITFESVDQKLIIKNVKFGEVWICSGQSNMEMPLQGWPPGDIIKNSAEEIANADYPDIRMFTVQKAISAKPLNDVEGNWDICTPENAPMFSSTAYFFGRKLHKELDVPIGLIHSSWGGTPVESWISSETLQLIGEFPELTNNLDKVLDQQIVLDSWIKQRPVLEMSPEMMKANYIKAVFSEKGPEQFEYDDTKWKKMNLPGHWEYKEPGNFDGVIWFRKEFTLTEEQCKSTMVLELGPVDDMDETFLNGKRIGGYLTGGYWNFDRRYVIKRDLLKPGKNVLAVKVIDNGGGGGIYAHPDKFRLISEDEKFVMPLEGTWKYLPIAELRNGKYYLYAADSLKYYERPELSFQISQNTASFLYNAMIAPLLNYKLCGAIWYQGESNVGRSAEYNKTFPAMIENWREAFNNEHLPFYFVQIAPFNYGSERRSELLREAQLNTLKLKNTGMAVTHDITQNDNIHPANKQDVGLRLAYWALAKQYGKDIPYSGPLAERAIYKNGKIQVRFGPYPMELEIKNDLPNQFEICGENGKFVEAKVTIQDGSLIIYSEDVPFPTGVRYAWGNITPATLFSKDGLPASSFRLFVK